MNLLRRCEERSVSHPETCDPPNARAVSAALEAVIKSGGRGHSRLAEDLLFRMICRNGEGEWKGKNVGKKGGG